MLFRSVTHSPNSSLPPSDWSRPSRAGVRVVSSSSGDVREEITDTARRDGLVLATNVVLLRWLDDPEAAVSAQYWMLLTVFCVCLIIWIVLVLFTQWRALRRERSGRFAR